MLTCLIRVWEQVAPIPIGRNDVLSIIPAVDFHRVQAGWPATRSAVLVTSGPPPLGLIRHFRPAKVVVTNQPGGKLQPSPWG